MSSESLLTSIDATMASEYNTEVSETLARDVVMERNRASSQTLLQKSVPRMAKQGVWAAQSPLKEDTEAKLPSLVKPLTEKTESPADMRVAKEVIINTGMAKAVDIRTSPPRDALKTLPENPFVAEGEEENEEEEEEDLAFSLTKLQATPEQLKTRRGRFPVTPSTTMYTPSTIIFSASEDEDEGEVVPPNKLPRNLFLGEGEEEAEEGPAISPTGRPATADQSTPTKGKVPVKSTAGTVHAEEEEDGEEDDLPLPELQPPPMVDISIRLRGLSRDGTDQNRTYDEEANQAVTCSSSIRNCSCIRRVRDAMAKSHLNRMILQSILLLIILGAITGIIFAINHFVNQS
jgi:hypothetical protein